MGNKQIKAGGILSYVQMALNILIGLIYTPLMIKLLGKSEYGLYNTVASTISMLSVLNLGFGSGYIKYYSKYKAKKDEESIQKLNGLFLIIFVVIACVAIICGIYITTHLELVFSNGLSDGEYYTARILMWLLIINLSIGFPMSVFANIISAHERFVFLKLAGMGKSVLSPILTIPLLLLGYGSIGVVVVTVAISLIVDCTYIYFVFFKLRQKFVFNGFEKGIFKSLFSYTFFIAINIIIDQINWNIDKIILARYSGTAVVAVYSIGATLQTYYNMFSTAVSSVFTPRIHNLLNNTNLSTEEKSGLISNLFMRVGRIQFLILGLVCSGFIFFGKSFIRLWAGEGYEESYYVALLLIIPVTIPLIQNLGIEIQRAENKHRFRSIAYLFMAFLNLTMSIYLCQIFGATGAAFGTAVSLVLANGLVMNIYYHKKCGINVVDFWKSILHIMIGIVPAIGIGIIITLFLKTQDWLQLVIAIILYSIVYTVSIWLFSMNNEEKEIIRVPIKKIVNKLHD